MERIIYVYRHAYTIVASPFKFLYKIGLIFLYLFNLD